MLTIYNDLYFHFNQKENSVVGLNTLNHLTTFEISCSIFLIAWYSGYENWSSMQFVTVSMMLKHMHLWKIFIPETLSYNGILLSLRLLVGCFHLCWRDVWVSSNASTFCRVFCQIESSSFSDWNDFIFCSVKSAIYLPWQGAREDWCGVLERLLN